MNSATLEYKKKVWRFLENMKPEKRYSVDKIAKPENREALLAAIKEYMTSLPYDGWISFNSDYTQFYRVPPVPWEQLDKITKAYQ